MTIFEKLKKIHPDLKFIGISDDDDICLIFESRETMYLSEFEKGSETRNLMIEFENRFF